MARTAPRGREEIEAGGKSRATEAAHTLTPNTPMQAVSQATLAALRAFPDLLDAHFAAFPRSRRHWAPASWEGVPSEALTAIASGQGGGPIAALGPLVGRFGGAEARPIKFEGSGMRRSVSIPGVLDIAIEGVAGASPGQPIYLDNVGHPAATRIALAKASRSHMHAFGIDWDETSGQNNGHFAPFDWSSG